MLAVFRKECMTSNIIFIIYSQNKPTALVNKLLQETRGNLRTLMSHTASLIINLTQDK